VQVKAVEIRIKDPLLSVLTSDPQRSRLLLKNFLTYVLFDAPKSLTNCSSSITPLRRTTRVRQFSPWSSTEQGFRRP
jgi:hypothetical protein